MFLPGLTKDVALAGASSRANLDDVAEPRSAGHTKQDSLRNFSFQIDSKNAATSFYTIQIASSAWQIFQPADISATCSCPFRGSGWCKHVVKCLFALVEPAPPLKKRRKEPAKQKQRCARCDAFFFDAEVCRRPHPPSMVENGKCARCGKDSSGYCFVGTHDTSLMVLTREGWPDDDDDD